jgi:hypothetical protein
VAADSKPASRSEESFGGPVRLVMTVTPSEVEYDKDVLLTLAVTAPPTVDVTLPPLEDRVQGFDLNGYFSEEPDVREGSVTRVHHARLTPRIAPEHRVAPIAVAYVDRGASPPVEGWFPTRALGLPLRARPSVAAGADVDAALSPVWIPPSRRAVLLALLAAVAGAGVLVLLWVAARKLRRQARLRRLSPLERALRELEELLARDLVGRGLVKDFYVDLTMVVRRYIERAHAIRAPEQTTEEFLAAAAVNARFTPRSLATLRAFLEAADLVKFAAHHPDSETVARAVSTARGYLETDAAEAGPGGGVRAGGGG